jgi:cytochrome P450
MNSTLPAGPTQSPVRQLIEMGTHPFTLLDPCRRDYGDVFTLRMFGQGPFVLIGDSEAVRWIFSQPRSAFTHANDLVGIVIGDRVCAVHGRGRTPAGAAAADAGLPRRADALLRRDHARGGRTRAGPLAAARYRDCPARYTRITLEVICRCLFGEADGVPSERLRHQVERFLDAAQTPTLFMAGTLIPRTRIRVLLQRRTDISLPVRVLSSVPRTLLWREVADSREKICRAVDAEIAACRAGDPRYEGTILRMLADTKDEAGVGLTDEQINDEFLTLLMAGHETTATTLAWALHHLAANPAAQQRLFEELSGSFPEGVVDPDRARKLPYLTTVRPALKDNSGARPAAPVPADFGWAGLRIGTAMTRHAGAPWRIDGPVIVSTQQAEVPG